MGITLNQTRFIYTEPGKEQVLLDCGDFLSNKSRIPLQAEGENVLELLVALAEKESHHEPEFVLPSLLINILVTSQLIRYARPFRVLEYGCGAGRLSFHLAELLGSFCEKSSLICTYDTLDIKWIEWKEKISQIKQPPQISYLAGDYCNLQLQKNYFDIILINGTVNYKAPCQMLKNSLQLLTNEGILICYITNSSPLEDAFKCFFTMKEEYNISASYKIFVAKAVDKCLKDSEYSFKFHAQSHLRKAQNLLQQADADKGEISDMIKILQQDIKTAVNSADTALKIQLLDIKSDLIEKRLKYYD